MKNVFLVLLMVCGFGLTAQSPYSVFNSANEKGVSTQQVSLNNVWVGSKLSMNLNDEAPLNENFVFTARVIYTPYFTEKFALPIAITVSPSGSDVQNPDAGVNFGLYPYLKLISSGTTTLLAHGGVAFRTLQNEGEEAVQQFRALAGLEIAIAPKTGGAPITLSATPVFSNTSGSTGNSTHLEITGILPISKNLGALIDWSSSGIGSGFRVGVIVNSALGK